jgi:hypothetical protein
MANRIPSSTIFFVEGLPLDISDPELENFRYFMDEQLQIGVDHHRTKTSIRQQINQNTTTKRLPNSLFGMKIYMAPEAATFAYGFYHGNQQRLALRLIPITCRRPYASSASRQAGHLTSYVSVHPIPVMGAFTADVVADKGSTALTLARMLDQVPGTDRAPITTASPTFKTNSMPPFSFSIAFATDG